MRPDEAGREGRTPSPEEVATGDRILRAGREIRRLLDELMLVYAAGEAATRGSVGQPAPIRRGPSIPWRPHAPLERDERPLFVVGVSTWNREAYIHRFVESFVATRSDAFNWALVIADDGSTDDTIDYLDSLSIPDCQVVVVKNKGRTIAGQANTILQVADALDFDFGIKCDDDIFFTSPGWDRLYYEAAQATGVHHLVYHNVEWKPARHDVGNGLLHSSVGARESMGCLYTFTPSVVAAVGFMDGAEFDFRGHSHIDFTVRCCRAGFNDEAQLWDAAGSNTHVGMWSRDEYIDLVDWSSSEVKSILTAEERVRRMSVIDQHDRVFVPATAPDYSTPRSRFVLSPVNDAVAEALQVVPTLEEEAGLLSGFDAIFVLNLAHDVEKWMVTAAMLGAHGLEFERFPGVDGNDEQVVESWRAYASLGLTHELERRINRKLIQSPGAWGYLLTMEALLETAEARRLRRILVFDDDVMLHRRFAEVFEHTLAELPHDWKLLYLGRSQVDRDAEARISERLVHPGQGANGSFAIALDSSVFDLALDEVRRFDWPFDSGALREIDRRYPNRTLAAEPPLVVADVTESAIRKSRNLERFAQQHGWEVDEYEPRRHRSRHESEHTVPLVSVVVPCSGDEPTIGDALSSLRVQSHGRLEILAVLTEATPRMVGTLERLRDRDSRLRVLVLEDGGDEAAALNGALSFAHGRHLRHTRTHRGLVDRSNRAVCRVRSKPKARRG